MLDKIAAEQDGRLRIVRLNIATKYRITSIPALKVFQGGEEVREIIGAMPKPMIEDHLKGII